MFNFIFIIMDWLMVVIGVLIGVAFITLFERSILGYVQLRKGPNKVGYVGVLQPFSDAIKSFFKESSSLIMFNYLLYYLCPVIGLFLMLVGWLSIPWDWGLIDLGLGLIYVLCVLSFGVYNLLGAGWSSNSKYALLGGLRAVAQTISYEVSFALILISLVLMTMSYDLFDFSGFGFVMFLFFPLLMSWGISMLAELNRTPFDFAEGESELVSGFNVEYSGVSFVLIFMAEYGMIIFLSAISVMFFFGSNFFIMKLIFVSFLVILIRGSYPRYRYDKLMELAWKGLLPFVLNYFLLLVGGMMILI